MSTNDAVVAVFPDHHAAEAAIRKLAEAGLPMRHFSIIGKGYHSESNVVGFYNTGDRIKFWGKTGAVWGGLWGLFFGGISMTVPVIGPVMVLGHLAAMVFAAIEGAIVVAGLSALGAAIASIGIPKDSVIEYEEALKSDGFLLVGHGLIDEMARAKVILEMMDPVRLDMHEDVKEMKEMTRPPANHSDHPEAV